MNPLSDATIADQSPTADVAVSSLAVDVADGSLTADAVAPQVSLAGLGALIPVAQPQPRGDCQPLRLVFDVVSSAVGDTEVAAAFVGENDL